MAFLHHPLKEPSPNEKSHARQAPRVAFRVKPASLIGFDCTALLYGCKTLFSTGARPAFHPIDQFSPEAFADS
jgi:hypothetical protein